MNNAPALPPVSNLPEIPDSSGVMPVMRWLLEYVFDGEEKGSAVYTSEQAALMSADMDGGTVVGLVRQSDAESALSALRAEHAAEVARLRAALLETSRRIERLKRPCGMDPETPQALRNGEYASVSQYAFAAAQPQGESK